MQFLILFTRDAGKAATPTPAELREAEFEQVRRLYTEGVIRQIWLRGDAPGACAIVEAATISDATEQVNSLPLARAGLLQTPTIVPINPYPGFANRPRNGELR
jgi:hypothetical protein